MPLGGRVQNRANSPGCAKRQVAPGLWPTIAVATTLLFHYHPDANKPYPAIASLRRYQARVSTPVHRRSGPGLIFLPGHISLPAGTSFEWFFDQALSASWSNKAHTCHVLVITFFVLSACCCPQPGRINFEPTRVRLNTEGNGLAAPFSATFTCCASTTPLYPAPAHFRLLQVHQQTVPADRRA